MITATLGILVSMAAETMVTFEGNAWADSSVTLAAGSNLIGLPVNDPNVTMISDIQGSLQCEHCLKRHRRIWR